MPSRWPALVLSTAFAACASESEPAPDANVLDASSIPDANIGPDAGTPPDASTRPDASVPPPACGNATTEPGELCDDGNANDDDDCSNLCTLTAPFRAYDAVVRELLTTWSIPGATVALTRNERLVHLRAYGFADPEETRSMAPHLRFRIASVSKPITAVAIMKLVEDGRLSLDEPAFTRLTHLEPPEGNTPDPRLGTITVRHLLEHSAGWDRAISGDPMFQSTAIANAMGVPPPAEAETIVAYMKGQPLDFDPGTSYAYSNFGYSVLGRLIEVVTSTSYEHYVQQEVLRPMGIHRMAIGRTRPELRPEDEVAYESTGSVSSVFPDVITPVPIADGGWYNEALDSHGGWIASAADLARFMTAVDGRPLRPDLLSASSLSTMVARPAVPGWAGQPAWYALGWLVRPTGTDANLWHGGSLPGTTTLIVRTGEGVTWTLLLNSRPGTLAEIEAISADVDAEMWRAVGTVTEWPEVDLFDRVP